jgi:hypothetical protein
MSFTTAPIAARSATRSALSKFASGSEKPEWDYVVEITSEDHGTRTMLGGTTAQGNDRGREKAVVRKAPKRRTLRRVSGFLIETHGEDSKVGFIEAGSVNIYSLPSKVLKLNGIHLKNQPFEMDEVMLDAALIYEFRPLAEAKDAETVPIALDEDRKKKLALLLADDAED